MAATPVEAEVLRLDSVEQAGPNRSTAPCPGHDPSLRVSGHLEAG